MRLLKQYLPCLALTLLVAIVGGPCRAQDSADMAKMIHAPPAELLNRPPHFLPPARILAASGAAGAKANSAASQLMQESARPKRSSPRYSVLR
jgi:hypothetical protein